MGIRQTFRSKLLRDTASYSIINILDKAIPFLIMPIISRVLTKEDMGYYSLYQVTFQILIPILTLCLEYPIYINYFKIDKDKYPQFFSTGVWLTIFVFIATTIISLLFFNQLSSLFGLNKTWLFVTYIIVFLNYFCQLRLILWQQQQKPHSYGLFSVPFVLIKNILGLLIILLSNIGWQGIIIGHLIGQVIFCSIAIVSFVKEGYLILYFDKKEISKQIKVGVPVCIHKISGWLSHSLNRIIINSLLGASATGSYGIGATFGTIVTVIEDAVNKAYAPYLFEQWSKYNNERKKKLTKLIVTYYSLFISFGVFLSLIGYFGVGFIFGEKYTDTRHFIIPIVLSSVINGLYKLHVNFIFYTEKTHLVATNTIICAILNIFVAYIFTYFWGLWGAAVSTIIIQFILYLLTIIVSHKYYPIYGSRENPS